MKKTNENSVELILEYIEIGDYEAALNLIFEQKDRYGESVDFLKAEALLCLKVGEYQTAISLLKKAEKIASDDIDIYSCLSYAYEKILQSKEEPEVVFINSDDRKAVQYSEADNLYKIRSAMRALRLTEKDPLVSVFFIAYNNLETLTKPAMESLLKYTSDIDFELILLDNGSTDGTLEYFKSIPWPRKKIFHVSKNIGAFYGQIQVKQYCRGKYVLVMPNDTIVTKNWLKNMLSCIESDERIGMVVPMSDNISNFESVDLKCENIDDMQIKAEKFNVSAPEKWEERLRLVPTIMLVRYELWILYIGDDAFIYNFSDDDLSMQYRRLGYKLIVCGDVFVHHGGSVVMGKNPQNYAKDMEKGRLIYQEKYYGLDAWHDVCNYEKELFSILPIKPEINKIVNCLGVDVRCGTPLLELKNKLRAIGIKNTNRYAFSAEAKYWLDLKTICNSEVVCDRPDFFDNYFGSVAFDYVLLGEYINSYSQPLDLLKKLGCKLAQDGILAIKCKNPYDLEWWQHYSGNETFKQDVNLPDKILAILPDINCQALKIANIEYPVPREERQIILSQVSNTCPNANLNITDNLFVKEYIIIIGKM